MTPLQDLWDQLVRHDWFFEYSDDHSVWSRGRQREGELRTLAGSIEGGLDLYNAFSAHHFSGDAWLTKKQPKPERPT